MFVLRVVNCSCDLLSHPWMLQLILQLQTLQSPSVDSFIFWEMKNDNFHCRGKPQKKEGRHSYSIWSLLVRVWVLKIYVYIRNAHVSGLMHFSLLLFFFPFLLYHFCFSFPWIGITSCKSNWKDSEVSLGLGSGCPMILCISAHLLSNIQF